MIMPPDKPQICYPLSMMKTADTVPQCYLRPNDNPPGYLKKQLPTKHLKLAARGELNALKQLLSEHPELLNHKGSFNRTFLWEAVRRGRVPLVEWLVEQGADIDTCGAYNNESTLLISPYCAALYYRRPKIADYLLSRGAKTDIFRAAFLGDIDHVLAELDTHPEMLNAEDPFDTVYHAPLIAFAVKGGSLPLVEALLKRDLVIAPYSLLLIGLAISDSRKDMVELLVANGALLSAINLGMFVKTDDISWMRQLIEKGVDVNASGINNFPPLIYLCRGDKGESVEKIKLLLEYGADVNAIGPQGKTALHYAAKAGYLNTISLLLDKGADPNIEDQRNETPLSLAIAAGKQAAAELLNKAVI